ncbi:ribosomal protein L21-like protein [Dipodascopsis uninucleata]
MALSLFRPYVSSTLRRLPLNYRLVAGLPSLGAGSYGRQRAIDRMFSTSSVCANQERPGIPSTSASEALTEKLTLNSTINKPTDEDLLNAFKPSGFLSQSTSTQLYATFRIHKQSYLVTVGDTVTLPYNLKDAEVGDVIRMTQVETMGSRNFTWKGQPFIDDPRCLVRARVIEHTKEPLQVSIKKKQRTRKTKHVKSKQKHTVIRISEIGVNISE